jgi:hypothetical protein
MGRRNRKRARPPTPSAATCCDVKGTGLVAARKELHPEYLVSKH